MSVEEIKREAIHIHSALSSAYKSSQQLNSPDKINDEIIKDFKNRSKPIKLITTEKDVWTSKVIFFDSEFLYVRVPPNFESHVGSLMIVQFPSEDGGSVIQSYIHKVNTPILCLKFLDPRKDTRYIPTANITVNYAELNKDISWLNSNEFYIIRLGEDVRDDERKIIVRDSIGSRKERDRRGKLFFTVHDEYAENLKKSFKHAKLFDISLGGLSINCSEGELEKHSIVYINTVIKNDGYIIKEIDLSLFGIVCSIYPLDEDTFRCGISFINRVVLGPIDNFFKKMKTYKYKPADR